MGDTLSFKITEKVIDLEHLSRSRYGSTDEFRLNILKRLYGELPLQPRAVP